MGLVSDDRWRRYSEKQQGIDALAGLLGETWVQPGDTAVEASIGQSLTREYALSDLVKRPEAKLSNLLQATRLPEPDASVVEQVEIDHKYQGYIHRQLDEIARVEAQHNLPLPETLDYSAIAGLSNEVVAKLTDVRPATLGQAGRISGVTPAAISLLLVYLKKKQHAGTRQIA